MSAYEAETARHGIPLSESPRVYVVEGKYDQEQLALMTDGMLNACQGQEDLPSVGVIVLNGALRPEGLSSYTRNRLAGTPGAPKPEPVEVHFLPTHLEGASVKLDRYIRADGEYGEKATNSILRFRGAVHLRIGEQAISEAVNLPAYIEMNDAGFNLTARTPEER